MVMWSHARGDGHHEGNPHPDDIPQKKEKEEVSHSDDESSSANVDEGV